MWRSSHRPEALSFVGPPRERAWERRLGVHVIIVYGVCAVRVVRVTSTLGFKGKSMLIYQAHGDMESWDSKLALAFKMLGALYIT